MPKLVLPKFSGDVIQWQSFWDQFTAAVHLSDLPDINKFTYLRSLLEGEAQEAIQGLALTEQHYRVACQILQERFGRKERIIFKHVQALLNLSSVTKNNSMSGLQKLQDMLLSHVRSLESLGIAGDNYGVLLTPIVLSSLPADIRMQWARVSDGQESNLTWLLEFLGKEISLREKSLTFRDLVKPPDPAKHWTEKRSRPTATSLPTSSFHVNGCVVCGKSHNTHKCWELVKSSLKERRGEIRTLGLCF